MWINRHPLNNSLVVLLHGIRGDAWGTWRPFARKLQDDFRDRPLIRSYDILSFGYPSSLGRQPDLVPHILNDLSNELDRHLGKYRCVSIIAHSQGGVLGKLYILSQVARRGRTPELIITIGTPHLGTWYANAVIPLAKVPLLQRYVGFHQFGQLGSLSRTMRRLRNEWPKQSPAGFRSIAVCCAFDRWVSDKSASGIPPIDEPTSILSDHSPTDQVYNYVIARLEELGNTSQLTAQVRSIRTSPSLLDKYVTEHTVPMRKLVETYRPSMTAAGWDAKVNSLLADFLWNYPVRPFRGLGLSEAVTTFAERQLADELL